MRRRDFIAALVSGTVAAAIGGLPAQVTGPRRVAHRYRDGVVTLTSGDGKRYEFPVDPGDFTFEVPVVLGKPGARNLTLVGRSS